MGTTGVAAAIIFGPSTSSSRSQITLNNTPMTLSAATDGIAIRCTRFKWLNTASATLGTVPTTLFQASTPVPGNILLEGIDLSAIGSGKTLVGTLAAPSQYIFKDCKLGASVTIAATQTDQAGAETYVSNSDSSGTNYRNEKYHYPGTLTTDTVVVKTSGASNGTTAISWKLVTTANSKWLNPLELFPISIWNNTTASNVIVTLEGIYNAAALPKNDEFWFDLEYLGSAATPISTHKTGSKADGLAAGSNLTASTKAWDTLVTARANTTAYSVNDVIKVATNPDRIFFCTTAGTSNGSEPAGYASAIDGGSVTDNTAVFRAGVRFSCAVTATSPQPAQTGLLFLYPKMAVASALIYLDPLAILS
jgi:hypothetical protein